MIAICFVLDCDDCWRFVCVLRYRSKCLLYMNDFVVLCSSISSCQSAATARIVKRFLALA